MVKRWVAVFPLAVWGYALLIAALLSVPYVVGLHNTPSGWEFSGAAPVPAGFMTDFNSHLAKMWQGWRGDWAYHLLFTHERHVGIYGVQSFYVALGALARLFTLDLPVMYHIARVLLSLGVVLAMWRIAGRFFATPSERWTALLFGTIVTGWGWLLYLVPSALADHPPLEFWLMDAYHLMGAFYMPHFSAAIILQIVAFLVFLAWLATPRAGSLIVLTVVLAVLALIQPYVVLLTLTVFVSVALYQLVWLPLQRRTEIAFGRLLALSVPLAVHGSVALLQYIIMRGDPVWNSFSQQNITLSPAPYFYVFAYLPFLLPMAALLWRRKTLTLTEREVWFLPVVWISVVLLLLYAPFPTQRRYLLGVQTPLALCAALGWSRVLLPAITPRLRRLVAIPYLAAGSLALLLLGMGNLAAMNPTSTPALYSSPDELAGYAWLRQNVNPRYVILSTLDGNGQGSGGRIVAKTGFTVYLGHWIETAEFWSKYEYVSLFYNPSNNDTARMDFLMDTRIRYIWYDDHARTFGNWNPATSMLAQEVFSSGRIKIFFVDENAMVH